MLDINLLLAWGATYKKVDTGEIIFNEGMQCHFYFQLVSGRVRWVNIDDSGKEFLQNMIEEGESFGELPLFDDDIYAGSAIADEPSVILRLHKPIFRQMISENQQLHFEFTRLLSKRIRFKNIILKSLAFDDPEERIFTLLSYLKTEKKNFCKNQQLNLTRQQIADMTGLRVETVIRTMRHMHDRGELLIERGKVFC